MGVCERVILKWILNKWIHVRQNKDEWQTVVNTVMNFILFIPCIVIRSHISYTNKMHSSYLLYKITNWFYCKKIRLFYIINKKCAFCWCKKCVTVMNLSHKTQGISWPNQQLVASEGKSCLSCFAYPILNQPTFPCFTLWVLTSKICLIIRGSPQLPYANSVVTQYIERPSFYIIHITPPL